MIPLAFIIWFTGPHECGDHWPDHMTIILRSTTNDNAMFLEVGCDDVAIW